MLIKHYIAAVTAGILVSACSSDDIISGSAGEAQGGEMQGITFSATHEGDGISSKAVQTSDLYINWESGDVLSVFDGKSNCPFTLTSGAGTTSAQFSGSVQAGATSYYALHPYQSGATYSNGTISNITLPSVQTAREGSFAPEAALMVAVADENKNLAFHNLCACVKLTVSETVAQKNIKSITLIANGGQTLAGTFSVADAYSTTPNVSSVTNASSEVSIIPATGTSYIAAGTYYITTLPVTIEGAAGFTITFLCEGVESSQTYSTSAHSLVLQRNVNTSIGTVTPTDQGEWVDMGTTKDGSTDGVLWRNRNIGATSISDFGDYYAWGETVVKYTGFGTEIKTKESGNVTNYYNDITLKNYASPFNASPYKTDATKWANGYVNANTPYFLEESTSLGVTTVTWDRYTSSDSRTTLESSDDVAYQTLTTYQSKNVRIPTAAEMSALTVTTDFTWTWKENYLGTGVPGYLITSKKTGYVGNHIFLPAGGRCQNCVRYLHENEQSNYWTSSVNTENTNRTTANVLYFNNDATGYAKYAVDKNCGRYMGCLIRPIKNK